MQANIGAGLPSSSFLALDSGILQSIGSVTFNRSLGTSSSAFEWTANGGGFSATSGTMTVLVNNNASTPLTWGTSVGTQIVGTLKLNSTTATGVTLFQNKIDLSGADRTIQVDDNSSSTTDYATISGAITGTGGIIKTGSGLLKLTGANTYSGTTSIAGGTLQATIGSSGIPTNSFIELSNGGVLQFNNTSSFTSSLGTTGATIAWGLGGGGFSAGTTSLTVNIGGHTTPDTLLWGDNSTDLGAKLLGPLTLNAPTASSALTFQNGIDLCGGARTLVASTNSVTLSGAIIDSVGGGSLTKNGSATLYISGTAGNTYTGPTTITGGYTYLNKSSGYAIPGNLTLSTPVDTPGVWTSASHTFVVAQGANQISPSCVLSFVNFNGDNYAQFELYGHSMTLAGLSGVGVVENTESETGIGSSTLTINSSTNCSFSGYLRNTNNGSGALSVVKTGAGTQTLAGDGISYTGSTTISQGTLILQDITSSTILSQNFNVGGTLGIGCTNGNNPSYTGVISGTGSLLITGPDDGGGNPVTLAGSSGNTYLGTTTISGGRVILAKTSGYAIPGNFTIANQAAFVVVTTPSQIPSNVVVTLVGDYDGNMNPHFEVYGNTINVTAIAGTGGAIENTENETGIGNGTLVFNNNTNYALNGVIIRNGTSGTLALVKNGTGSLTISGSYCGQYTGGLTVNNGAIDYSSGTLPSCNYTITGGALNIGSLTQSIGTFQITGGTLTGSSSGQLTSNAAYDIEAGLVVVKLAGGIALNKTTTGTAILTGSNTYTGATTISAGTLQLGNGGSTGALSSSTTIAIGASGTFDYDLSSSLTLTARVSGSGTLKKDGTGTLTMSGSNSFSGNLIVNSGTLAYNANLPTGSYTINGGTLNTSALSASISAFQITGGTATGSGTLTSSTAYDLEGGSVSVGLGGSAGLNKSTAGSVTLTKCLPGGNYVISTGTLNINSLSRSIGTFQITGGTVTGTGTLTGSTAYDLENGTVSAGLGGSVGLNKSTSGTVSLTRNLPGGNYAISAGTLNINALSQSIGTFQITGGTVTGTGTLTSNVAYDVRGGTVQANLAGASIGLTKSTSTYAVLSGANSYTGRTTVTGGTLELGPAAQNCVLNLGGADVQSGALVFDYAGGADPAATIEGLLKASCDGGRWDVGQFRDSTASATGLTLGCFDNTATDQVKVMPTYPGDFNLDGVVDSKDRAIWFANAFVGTTWQQGDANYDGAVDGLDRDLVLANTGLPPIAGMPAAAGVTPVPEPGTLALLATGLLSLLAFARRWRKHRTLRHDTAPTSKASNVGCKAVAVHRLMISPVFRFS